MSEKSPTRGSACGPVPGLHTLGSCPRPGLVSRTSVYEIPAGFPSTFKLAPEILWETCPWAPPRPPGGTTQPGGRPGRHTRAVCAAGLVTMGPIVDVYKGPFVFCLLLVLGQNVGKTIKNHYHGYQAIDYAGAILTVVG